MQQQQRRVVFDDDRNQTSVLNAPSYSRYAPVRPPVGPRISTTKDHYKWWKADPSPPFCELPTFSNYLIYPGRGRNFQTTTQAFFKGEPGFRPPMIKPRDDESLDLLGITSRGQSVRSFYEVECKHSHFLRVLDATDVP